MFELPLESEVSSVFPSKRVEVRPGVQLWISSGTMKQKLQRKASTTSSIFELAYSQEKSLYSELGRASVEIKPGYSNLGFSVKISLPLENTGVSSVFAASVWPFSLIFSLARRNEGNFFQAVPTTLSRSLAEVRLASLVAWA